MPDSPSVADINTSSDQSHNSIIKIVWKIVYWILALFFLGFGFFAVIGGEQWWGAIFIINGFLFIYSSPSLNRKSSKVLDREVTYLVLVLFFCSLGIIIALTMEHTTKQWYGIICFIIMTIFSVLSVSLKDGSKVNPVIEKFYKKASSVSFANVSTLLGSFMQIKPEIKRMEITEGNKTLSLFEKMVGIVTIITGIIAIYSFFKGV